MKKLVLLLAVVFGVSLVSCGGSKDEKKSSDTADSAKSSSENPAPANPNDTTKAQ